MAEPRGPGGAGCGDRGDRAEGAPAGTAPSLAALLRPVEAEPLRSRMRAFFLRRAFRRFTRRVPSLRDSATLWTLGQPSTGRRGSSSLGAGGTLSLAAVASEHSFSRRGSVWGSSVSEERFVLPWLPPGFPFALSEARCRLSQPHGAAAALHPSGPWDPLGRPRFQFQEARSHWP